MNKILFALFVMIITALPVMAAPGNTSGPWGIAAGGFKNLSTALASPATVGKTVVVTEPMAINSMTVTGGRTVKVISGGRIDPAVGQTLTFASEASFEAGDYQAFGGAGTVTGLTESRPEWFGDNGSALGLAVAAAPVVYLTEGKVYEPSATISLSDKAIKSRAGNSGASAPIIRPTAAVTVCLEFVVGSSIEGVNIDGVNTTDAIGIRMGEVATLNASTIRKVRVEHFTGPSGKGLYIRDAVGINFYELYSNQNTVGIDILGKTGPFPTYLNFYSCSFRESTTYGALVRRGHGIRFSNCLFESNANEGLKVVPLDVVERLQVVGCWFESNQGGTTNYQLTMDGSAGGATLTDIRVSDTYVHQSGTALAAHFIKALNVVFTNNSIPNVTGMVRFDTNSTGWISNQKYATTNVFTDVTGFMLTDGKIVGTFLPTIDGNTTSGIGTYTTQLGKYTREGNKITVWVYLVWTGHTGTGGMRLGSLPFTSSSVSYNFILTGVASNVALTASNVFAGATVRPSAVQADLLQIPTGGGTSVAIPMDTAGSLILTGSYFID